MISKVSILVVVISLIAAGLGVYAVAFEEGEQGPQGIPGAVGSTGLQGPQGEQGEKGEKGDTGDTGLRGTTGPRGPRGAPGEDGEDLEPNDAPVIYVNDNLSYVEGYPCSSNLDDFRYYLNITTNDTENDLRKVTVYYKWNENNYWAYKVCFPYLNNSDYVISSEERSGNYYYGDKTLYWLIECDDGENLVYLEGNTTLIKSMCL